jgi:hypothetical protein
MGRPANPFRIAHASEVPLGARQGGAEVVVLARRSVRRNPPSAADR